jgi:hypothetical protein
MAFELLDGSAADKRWSMNPLRSCCWMHHPYFIGFEKKSVIYHLFWDSPAAHCGSAQSQR